MRQLELFSASELCACAAKAQFKVLKLFLANVVSVSELNFAVDMTSKFISFAHSNMSLFAR